MLPFAFLCPQIPVSGRPQLVHACGTHRTRTGASPAAGSLPGHPVCVQLCVFTSAPLSRRVQIHVRTVGTACKAGQGVGKSPCVPVCRGFPREPPTGVQFAPFLKQGCGATFSPPQTGPSGKGGEGWGRTRFYPCRCILEINLCVRIQFPLPHK